MSEIDQVFKRVDESARSRSSVFRWLVKNHDAFARGLEISGVNWEAITEGFTELGLTANGGVPLTPKLSRDAWYRARLFVTKRRERKAKAEAPAKPAQPGQGQSALFGVRPQQTVTLYDEEPPPRPISRKGF